MKSRGSQRAIGFEPTTSSLGIDQGRSEELNPAEVTSQGGSDYRPVYSDEDSKDEAGGSTGGPPARSAAGPLDLPASNGKLATSLSLIAELPLTAEERAEAVRILLAEIREARSTGPSQAEQSGRGGSQ